MFEGKQSKANVQVNSWMHLVCQVSVVNEGQTEHVREHTQKHAHISALTPWEHGVGQFQPHQSCPNPNTPIPCLFANYLPTICLLFANYSPVICLLFANCLVFAFV